MTLDNAAVVERCLGKDGLRVVNRIIEVSDQGLAPKNDPALLALAMACSVDQADVRKAALDALPKVARIGTHLFHFAAYVEQFRGWGRSLRRAVANWYIDHGNLEVDLVKYKSRDGWSHKDLLNLAHPKPKTKTQGQVFRWACGFPDAKRLPAFIRGHIEALETKTVKDWVSLIKEHELPREALPTEALNHPVVWAALIPKMKTNALVRNLGKMTSIGMFKDKTLQSLVVKELTDEKALSYSRIHPIQLLIAGLTYRQGHGHKGKLTWQPSSAIIDALEEAHDLSYQYTAVCDLPVVIGIDVSGSMGSESVAGMDNLKARDAAAAVALVLHRVFTNSEVVYFDTGRHYPSWGRRASYKEVLADAAKYAGGTDCAVPIQHAITDMKHAAGVIILTDRQTWQGRQHPDQAMDELRRKGRADAKLVVCAMPADRAMIADPKDSLALNIVGLDTSVPKLAYDFLASGF